MCIQRSKSWLGALALVGAASLAVPAMGAESESDCLRISYPGFANNPTQEQCVSSTETISIDTWRLDNLVQLFFPVDFNGNARPNDFRAIYFWEGVFGGELSDLLTVEVDNTAGTGVRAILKLYSDPIGTALADAQAKDPAKAYNSATEVAGYMDVTSLVFLGVSKDGQGRWPFMVEVSSDVPEPGSLLLLGLALAGLTAQRLVQRPRCPPAG